MINWASLAVLGIQGSKAINNYLTKGGFHTSWAQGVKLKAHSNLGENAISWALGEKDGRIAQISSVVRKLLYEIHPEWRVWVKISVWRCLLVFSRFKKKLFFSLRSRTKRPTYSAPIAESTLNKEYSDASILATDEAAVISLLANQLSNHGNNHHQLQQQHYSQMATQG